MRQEEGFIFSREERQNCEQRQTCGTLKTANEKNDFLCLVVFRFVRSFGRKKTSSLRFKWHTCRSFVVLPTVPKRRALRAPFFGGGPISHRFVSRESIKKEDPWPILINMEVHA